MSLDELESIGLERMDTAAIRGFLSSQKVGVLGLPTAEGPYMIPMSYGFDGEDRLLFSFFVGNESKKAKLSEETNHAQFLVYAADSMFVWESVLLSGDLSRLPEDEWDSITAEVAETWRPALFEDAALNVQIHPYQFTITSQEGIRHTGLPPGFEP